MTKLEEVISQSFEEIELYMSETSVKKFTAHVNELIDKPLSIINQVASTLLPVPDKKVFVSYELWYLNKITKEEWKRVGSVFIELTETEQLAITVSHIGHRVLVLEDVKDLEGLRDIYITNVVPFN